MPAPRQDLATAGAFAARGEKDEEEKSGDEDAEPDDREDLDVLKIEARR